MTDPISDMLTQIRNAILVGKADIDIPHSKLKEEVAKVLTSSGFLTGAKAHEVDGRKRLAISINAVDSPAKITEIKRVSTPGRRHYVQAKSMPKVKSGRGLVIVSTSEGIMDGMEAVKKRLGGEIICEVY